MEGCWDDVDPQVKVSESEAGKDCKKPLLKEDPAFANLKNSLACTLTDGKK